MINIAELRIESAKELFRRKEFSFITDGNFPKQEEALQLLTNKVHTVVGYGGAAGGGKSATGALWLSLTCMAFPGTKAFIAREELKRLCESTLLTFFQMCSIVGIRREVDYKYNGQYHYIQFTNGSRIDLLDAKYMPTDPMFERFGSLEYTIGWIEEAGEIHSTAFEVLKSRTGRHKNNELGLIRKVFITLNPKKNWVYAELYKPWKEDRLPQDYAFIASFVQDNPYIDPGYIENLKALKNKVLKERLLYGNFEYDDDPSVLMRYDKILDMFKNRGKTDGINMYISCDVARMGRDTTTIAVWDNLQVLEMRSYAKTYANDVVRLLEELCEEYQVPRSHVIIDEDGVGGGTLDFFRGGKGFVNNSSPIHPDVAQYDARLKLNYANLKSQCYFLLAEKVNQGLIGIDAIDQTMQESLIEELEQVRQKDMDKEGKIAIEPKDIVKERIGRSPDLSDCLMMRMYFELNKSVRKEAVERAKPKRNRVLVYDHLTGEYK